MSPNGCKWLYIAVNGCTWLCMAVHGYSRLFMAVHDCSLLFTAIHGYSWLFTLVHGCKCSLHTLQVWRNPFHFFPLDINLEAQKRSYHIVRCAPWNKAQNSVCPKKWCLKFTRYPFTSLYFSFVPLRPFMSFYVLLHPFTFLSSLYVPVTPSV